MEKGKMHFAFGMPMACCNYGAMEFDSEPVVCGDCGGVCCSADCLNEHECEE